MGIRTAFCALALTLGVSGALAGNAAALDDFTSYRVVKSQPFTTSGVGLENDIASHSNVRVGKPERFAVPAVVTPPGDPIEDPDAHLNCYRIKAAPMLPRTIDVRDDFGDQRLTIQRASTLCLSAAHLPQPEAADLDDFTCYSVRSRSFGGAIVDVTDELRSAPLLPVLKPVLLCAPTSRDGSTVENPDDYLTCYSTPPRGMLASVPVQDDFTNQVLTVRNNPPAQVCRPAQKVIESKVQDKDTKFFGVFAGTDATFADAHAELDPCYIDAAVGPWAGWAAKRTTVLSEAGIINTPTGKIPCDQNGAAAGNGDPDTKFGPPNGVATEKGFRDAIAAIKPGGGAADKPKSGDELLVHIDAHGCGGTVSLDKTGNAADTDGQVSSTDLRDILTGFPAGVTITVAIDACQDGFATDLMGIKDDKGNATVTGQVEVLQATRSTESAQGGGDPVDTGGYFTVALVNCMKNKGGKTVADADFGNGDGRTSSLELHVCAGPVTTLIAAYCWRRGPDNNRIADFVFGDKDGSSSFEEMSKCGVDSWRGGKAGVKSLITKSKTGPDAGLVVTKQHPTFKEKGDPDKDPKKPDIDADGITNVDEIKTLDRVTNPYRKDTDADGLEDKDDIAKQCDPVDPDTDDDGTIDSDDPDCKLP